MIRLHAGNPGPMTGGGNWTYFLPGRVPVLIDAGVGEQAHLESIARARADGPGHVLVTHAHGDHISGAAHLAARWATARFCKFPWPERDARVPVPWSPLADGQVISAGDGELHAVHTPGHAPDHLAFWDPDSRTLFSGDLVTLGTTVGILASAGGSLAAYMASLERVLALRPARLLPAHGDPIDDPARLLTEYLDHRRHRHAQVLAALRSGVPSVEGIVARVYEGLAPALLPMARESVLAHLIALEEEGAATRADGAWRPTDG